MDKFSLLAAAIKVWLFQYGPNLIAATLVLLIGMFIINRLAKLVAKSLTVNDVDSSLRSFLSSIVSVGLKVLLLITVAGMIGIQTTSFVAIIGALGLAVGLALQGSLANFAGGVLILVFKPFKAGDFIEAGGKAGVVKEIQIFNTILLTDDHKTIILANGAVSNGTIVNHSRHGNLRIHLPITVSSANNLETIKGILINTISQNARVLQEPTPSIAVDQIGGGTITLSIHAYTSPADTGLALSELRVAIDEAFATHQVKSPDPAVTLVKNI
jgi:small conductance mechanosensitive channel